MRWLPWILLCVLLAGLLPARCTPIPDDAAYAPASTGTVTLDFIFSN